MTLYKLAHWLFEKKAPIIPRILELFIYFFFNAVLPAEVEIGEGSYLAHGGLGTVIHPKAKIGKRVIVGQGVTIGGKSLKSPGLPIVGDDVFIGAGAKILGDITIGDNCIIGANAVVVKSVPSNSIVGGVPAKIIRTGINARDYETW